MTESQIREAFHRKRLRRYHDHQATVVVDEFGLQHGRCRADIAVINGWLNGFEIKSDVDSLRRLSNQIDKYNAVFDFAYIIATERHLSKATKMIPKWWGAIVAREGPRGGIHFTNIRSSRLNRSIDDFSVAQLLWRAEACDILADLGIQRKLLRENRSKLYKRLVGLLDSSDLRAKVRDRLIKREGWRHRARPSQDGGLYPLAAKS